MAEVTQPRAAVIDIRILDGATGRMRSLGDGVMEQLLAITLREEVGLAPEVNIEFRAWEPERGFVLGNEDFLWPGTEIELWSGFDYADTCHGLFAVVSRDTSYPADDVPRLSVQAHGGLARLMNNQQSFVLEGVRSELPALSQVAERVVMELDADETLSGPAVPLGDRVKEAGKTDLEYVKQLAMIYGLAMPRVRYTPSPSGGRGTEALVLRKLRVASAPLSGSGELQFSADQGFQLRYLAGDSDVGGELASFDTSFDTQGLPTAVEVVGLDQATGHVVRVVVKMTSTGAVVESEEALEAKEIETATQQFRNWSAFDPKTITAGAEFVVAQLGDSGEKVETGLTYRYGPKRKTAQEKRWAREVLYASSVVASGSVRDYALSWMQARYEAFFTCSADVVPNLQGANAISIDQAHHVSGVMPADVGFYLVTEATHTWDDGGHRVSFSGQRVLVEGR